jgi:hypothetical protein
MNNIVTNHLIESKYFPAGTKKFKLVKLNMNHTAITDKKMFADCDKTFFSVL